MLRQLILDMNIMNCFRLCLLILLTTTISLRASAQRKVESITYNLMLKGLLKEDVPEFNAKDAYKERAKFQFIDAREKPEFAVSHIKNAVWVGYDDFDAQRLNGIPKDQPIIVYCSVGARSEKITTKLIADGYSHIYNLYGGIFEWINDGFPVFNSQDNQTAKVHACNRVWGIWLKKGDKVYQ